MFSLPLSYFFFYFLAGSVMMLWFGLMYIAGPDHLFFISLKVSAYECRLVWADLSPSTFASLIVLFRWGCSIGVFFLFCFFFFLHCFRFCCFVLGVGLHCSFLFLFVLTWWSFWLWFWVFFFYFVLCCRGHDVRYVRLLQFFVVGGRTSFWTLVPDFVSEIFFSFFIEFYGVLQEVCGKLFNFFVPVFVVATN